MPFTFKLSRRLARSRALVVALAAVVADACGAGEQSPTGVPSLKWHASSSAVASVAVSPSSASGSLGQSAQFTATAYNSSGTALTGQTFTWSSTDSTVVEVSATGYATAIGVGSATLVATDAGVKGTAAVTVSGDAVAAITVSPT